MTEATSMLLAAVVLRLAQRPVHLLEGGQQEAEVTPGGSKWTYIPDTGLEM